MPRREAVPSVISEALVSSSSSSSISNRVLIAASPFLHHFIEKSHEFYRQREDDGGIFLHANLRERLQIAQLQGDRLRGEKGGRVYQTLCGAEFAFSMDHLRPLFP